MGRQWTLDFDANSPDRAGELYAPDRAVGVQSRIYPNDGRHPAFGYPHVGIWRLFTDHRSHYACNPPEMDLDVVFHRLVGTAADREVILPTFSNGQPDHPRLGREGYIRDLDGSVGLHVLDQSEENAVGEIRRQIHVLRLNLIRAF